DVVLSPHAVAELLEWMGLASFGARTVLDGTSLLAGRRGELVCDESVTIVEDAAYAHPDAVGIPFDAEGTPRAPVRHIDRGRAGDPTTDIVSGTKLGRPSTGHALPLAGFVDFDGPSPGNLVLLPGDASVDDLIGRVDGGLFVTRFHYVNGLLDTRR